MRISTLSIGIFCLFLLLNLFTYKTHAQPDSCITAYGQCVFDFGVTGDGITDDADSIRLAFEAGVDLYFPKGTYKLCSAHPTEFGIDHPYILKLSSINNGNTITWHEEAVMIVCDSFSSNINPIRIIEIRGDPASDVTEITLNGPRIDGQNVIQNGTLSNPRMTGIGVMDRVTYLSSEMTDITINDAKVVNCTGHGIRSWGAKQVQINNAYTENIGYHGITAEDLKQDGKPIEFNINGHTSKGGSGHAIDWGGGTNPNLRGFGTAKNINAESPQYGIKIAGNWDLEISNMNIKDSNVNGFWVNFDLPNINVSLSDVLIENAKNTGIRLKRGNFKLKNVTILNSKSCNLVATRSTLDADGLIVITNEAVNDCYGGIKLTLGESQFSNFEFSSTLGLGQYLELNGTKANFNNGSIYTPGGKGALIRDQGGISSETCWSHVDFIGNLLGITYLDQGQDSHFQWCNFTSTGNFGDIICKDSNGTLTNCLEHTFTVHATTIDPDVGQIQSSPQICAFLEQSGTIGGGSSNKFENSQEAYSLFPTPFNNFFYIKGKDLKRISMFDLSGRRINIDYSILGADLNEVTNLRVDPGLYFILIESISGEKTLKKVLKAY